MDNYSFDLQRILFGDLPVLFFVEIALRTVILYLFALVMLRVFGKRSAGELTTVDVVVIVALGSAVGDPMFYPDVPVLHGMLVIALVVALQHLGIRWANQNKRVDQLIKGTPSRVVVDGILDLKGMEHANISPREVFQMARQAGYRNLGEIQRMYVETDDQASIFEFNREHIRPGLAFEPPWDVEKPHTLAAGSQAPAKDMFACANCGETINMETGKTLPPCPRCQQGEWIRAVRI